MPRPNQAQYELALVAYICWKECFFNLFDIERALPENPAYAVDESGLNPFAVKAETLCYVHLRPQDGNRGIRPPKFWISLNGMSQLVAAD